MLNYIELAKKELAIIKQTKRFDGHIHVTLIDYYKYCTQNTIDGLWLEFGVWCGATLKILSEISPVVVYGFDSFDGLPEDWKKSEGMELKAGSFKLGRIPVFKFSNHKIIPGLFEETLPTFLEEHKENCAVLHIDSDLYSSCKTIFNNLRDRIVPGTIILFDELIGYELYYEHEMRAWLEEDFNYEYLAWTHGPQTCVKIKE